MTNFIPIFPLSIVVYPGEALNLHIFEPRYKELIQDCRQSGKMFGIPAVVNNNMQDMGTLMSITEITKEYDNGEMDIKTRGIKVFRMLELVKTLPDKLYSGAIVHYPDNNESPAVALMPPLLAAIRQLHQLLKITKDFAKPDDELCSYDVAHHAGLTAEEEYELLGLLQEAQRVEYLKRHILKVLPLVAGLEGLKERIQMNGHFKNLGGFNL
jgi:uncharacterized protein